MPLFPFSACVFRARRDKLLSFFWVPKRCRPTPASIRGGGAIQAYRRGGSLQGILWRTRLISQSTLESYLQELAAESCLFSCQNQQRTKSASYLHSFPFALESRGVKPKPVLHVPRVKAQLRVDWQLLFQPCSIPSLLRFLDESLRSVSTAAKGYPSILFSCA